jgi:RimK-like ATP-grasp domain
MRTDRYRVAILNENEKWQTELCDKLRDVGIEVYKIPIEEYAFEIGSGFSDFDLVVNRASPSAAQRGHRAAIFFTLQLLNHFERLNIPVINGSRAYELEISKARQYQLLKRLHLSVPRTIVANSAERAVQAAREIGLPVVLKPNIGGSGAGVCHYEKRPPTVKEARRALKHSADGIVLVQEYLDVDDEATYRLQMIGLNRVYCLKAVGRGFKRCPSQDDCTPPTMPDCNSPDVRFEAHVEDPAILAEVRMIVEHGEFDTCGVEYLLSRGARYYFDINALSNIVRDPATVFKDHPEFVDPTDQLVKFIQQRLEQAARTAA